MTVNFTFIYSNLSQHLSTWQEPHFHPDTQHRRQRILDEPKNVEIRWVHAPMHTPRTRKKTSFIWRLPTQLHTHSRTLNWKTYRKLKTELWFLEGKLYLKNWIVNHKVHKQISLISCQIYQRGTLSDKPIHLPYWQGNYNQTEEQTQDQTNKTNTSLDLGPIGRSRVQHTAVESFNQLRRSASLTITVRTAFYMGYSRRWFH